MYSDGKNRHLHQTYSRKFSLDNMAFVWREPEARLSDLFGCNGPLSNALLITYLLTCASERYDSYDRRSVVHPSGRLPSPHGIRTLAISCKEFHISLFAVVGLSCQRVTAVPVLRLSWETRTTGKYCNVPNTSFLDSITTSSRLVSHLFYHTSFHRFRGTLARNRKKCLSLSSLLR